VTDYPYAGTLVADPITFQRAANAMITVYDANDTTNSTPLALKDTTGLPMANPVKSTGDAFIPPMLCPSEGRKLVGGGLTVIEFSHKGMSDAAAAAASEALGSAESAQAARAAAESAAAAASGGGIAVDPIDPDALIISTKSDGSVAVDPTDSDILVITT